MGVNVKIPTPLRKLTAGESQVEVSGGTVREIVDELEVKFPGLKERLCDESGEMRKFVNVYVGEEDIRFLDGLDTTLEDGAQVSIIPAVAGG